jgi:hypothetical protein
MAKQERFILSNGLFWVITLTIWIGHIYLIFNNNDYYWTINNFPLTKAIIGLLPIVVFSIKILINTITKLTLKARSNESDT